MTPGYTRFVQFVLKVSKFCNLRCRYCYEFNDRDKRDRMSREQIRTMYSTIQEYYEERHSIDGQRSEVHFIWHGGEPLLLEPSFYWDTFAVQREIFRDRALINSVQTNLTLLDEERIELLQNGFSSVGVSIDLYGGLRVNIASNDTNRR